MKRSAGFLLQFLPLLAALVVVVTAGSGRVSAQQPDLLYVCVQDDAKVAVVDMATRKVLRTIDFQALGFPATAKPHYVVVEQDGSYWYVSLIGANRVLKMDRQDKIAGQYEMETPGMLALSGTKHLAATRSMSAVNPPKRIAIIDRTTMKGDEVEVLFARPHPMAATATYAYTGSLGVNQIASISLADQKVNVTNVPGPNHSFVQFVVSQKVPVLVASTDVSGQILWFDIATPASPMLIKTIDVGKMAFDPVLTPDEKFVWVPVKSSNELVVISTDTAEVVARIKDDNLKQPQQIAFSSDGAWAFVTNNNKMDHMADPAMAGHAMPASDGMASLVVINTKTMKVDQAIPLGRNLTGMGTARK